MPNTSPPPAARRFQAIPVEETTRKVRRFAPEPVETTTRSRKMDSSGGNEEVAGKKLLNPASPESSFRSSKVNHETSSASSDPLPSSLPQKAPPADAPQPRRRFEPELIETLKRSKRAGDGRPATLPTDKVIAHSTQRARHINYSINLRPTLHLAFQTYTPHAQSTEAIARRPTPTRSNHPHPEGSSPCDHILIQE